MRKVPRRSLSLALGAIPNSSARTIDDDVTNRTNREFELETEIVVRADGKADNGLLYGAKVELQNSTRRRRLRRASAPTKPRSTWAAPGAVSSSAISTVPPIRSRSTPPWSAMEQIDGDAYDFLSVQAPIGNAPLSSAPSQWAAWSQAPDSDDATKISYITPRFAGFQAGASYAPQSNSEAQDVVAFKTVGGYKDFWEAAPELYGRALWLLCCCGRNCRRRYRPGPGNCRRSVA